MRLHVAGEANLPVSKQLPGRGEVAEEQNQRYGKSQHVQDVRKDEERRKRW